MNREVFKLPHESGGWLQCPSSLVCQLPQKWAGRWESCVQAKQLCGLNIEKCLIFFLYSRVFWDENGDLRRSLLCLQVCVLHGRGGDYPGDIRYDNAQCRVLYIIAFQVQILHSIDRVEQQIVRMDELELWVLCLLQPLTSILTYDFCYHAETGRKHRLQANHLRLRAAGTEVCIENIWRRPAHMFACGTLWCAARS